jgi:hypothetical protein
VGQSEGEHRADDHALPLERPRGFDGGARELGEHEVGPARGQRHSQLRELPAEGRLPLVVERPASLDLVRVAQAGARRDLPDRRHVERQAHTVHERDEIGREEAVADPQTRQRVDLREGA